MEGRLDVETSNRPCGRISRSLAFAAMRKGEARMRRSKGPKPLRRTPMSDSPARRETPTVLNLSNRRIRDPYVRWCGRGGAVRLPPIPIHPGYRRAPKSLPRSPFSHGWYATTATSSLLGFLGDFFIETGDHRHCRAL